ncbi:Zinc finger protein 862 [Nymphon striatum]|nr:Zinc finger protein 862 [Nymphon striatum]
MRIYKSFSFSGNIQRSTVVKHNESKDHKHGMEAHKMRQQLYSTNLDSDSETEKAESQLEFLRASGIDPSVTDIHPSTVKDVQHSLVHVLDQKLKEKMQECGFFGIIIDESTDLAVHKKLIVYLRYVHRGEIQTELIGNIRIDNGQADTITEELLIRMRSLGLDVKNLVGLGSDGASVMFGRKGGIGVRLEKDAPHMVHVHCVAHRLALACSDAAKNIPYLKTYKVTLKNLYIHVTGSAIRVKKLEDLQAVMEEPKLRLRDPISIRWLAMEGAVTTVHKTYGTIIEKTYPQHTLDNNYSIPHVNSVTSKTLFFNAIKQWNLLPNEIKIITDRVSFKKKVKKHLCGKQTEAPPYCFHVFSLLLARINLTGYVTSIMQAIRYSKLIFDGDERKFVQWEVRILAYLRLQGLWGTINPKSTEQIDQEKNAQVFAELIQFLDDKSLSLVMRDAKDDGRGATKILKEHYAGSGKPRVITLYTELTSLCLDGGESVTDYILRAESAATALRNLDEQVSDRLLVAMVLKGLPTEFKPFVAVITQKEGMLQFSEFKIALRNFEETAKSSGRGGYKDEILQETASMKNHTVKHLNEEANQSRNTNNDEHSFCFNVTNNNTLSNSQLLVRVQFKQETQKLENKFCSHRSFKNVNVDDYNSDLSSNLLKLESNHSDLNRIYSDFSSIFIETADKYAPIKRKVKGPGCHESAKKAARYAFRCKKLRILLNGGAVEQRCFVNTLIDGQDIKCTQGQSSKAMLGSRHGETIV